MEMQVDRKLIDVEITSKEGSHRYRTFFDGADVSGEVYTEIVNSPIGPMLVRLVDTGTIVDSCEPQYERIGALIWGFPKSDVGYEFTKEPWGDG